MSRTGTRGFLASALIALVAVALATVSVGLHRAGDPLVLPSASPTTVFASSHPAAATHAHLDPETSSETVLCLACLQKLERQTTLLAPTGSLAVLVRSRADAARPRALLAFDAADATSSRAPPRS